jgi:cytochrome P450
MADTATLTAFPFSTPPSLSTDPDGLRLLAEGAMTRARMANDGQEVWLALGYQANRRCLGDPRLLREPATRPGSPVTIPSVIGVTDVLAVMDPPRHTRLRRLQATAFTPRMVERLAPRIHALLNDLLDELTAQDGPVDLIPAFIAPLPITVIGELLGIPEADRSRLRDWAATLMSDLPLDVVGRAHQEVGAYLGELIARKRVEPGEDLTTALVEVHDEDGDRLTEAELIINLQTLMMAGHETTLNQLANGVVALSRNPDQFDLLRADPTLAGNAVEELMRYDKLLSSIMPKIAAEDLEVEGYRIREGEAVICVPNIANRDPAVFDNPNQLDITRANASAHLSFSHGVHFCLGANLARTELRAALTALVTRLPGLRIAVPDEELRWREGALTRTLLSLPVTW